MPVAREQRGIGQRRRVVALPAPVFDTRVGQQNARDFDAGTFAAGGVDAAVNQPRMAAERRQHAIGRDQLHRAFAVEPRVRVTATVERQHQAVFVHRLHHRFSLYERCPVFAQSEILL